MAVSYEIRVRGRPGPEVLHVLADLRPRPDDGVTVLVTGDGDQATLHGAFTRLRNLGLDIESVSRTDLPA